MEDFLTSKFLVRIEMAISLGHMYNSESSCDNNYCEKDAIYVYLYINCHSLFFEI